MKKLLLSLALIAAMGSVSFAQQVKKDTTHVTHKHMMHKKSTSHSNTHHHHPKKDSTKTK